MTEAAGQITAAEFERVAKTLSKWSARSLSVARALLVNREKLSVVAAQYDMKPQQASVIRSRFSDKVTLAGIKRVSALEFMAVEKPVVEAALEPFKSELIKLHRNHYSTQQMVLYLSKNNFETDEKTLNNFLQKALAK